MKFSKVSLSLSVLATLALAVPAAHAGDGSNLLQYLPANTQMVMTVNVANLRSAPVYQQVATMVTGTSEYQEMMSEISTRTSFNPVNDVNTVVMGSTVVSEAAGDSFVFIVEANVNFDEIYTALESDGTLTRQNRGDVVFYGDNDYTLAFLAPGVIALGTPSLLNQSIAVAAGEAAGASPPSMTAALSGVDRSRSMWVAVNAPPEQAAEIRTMSVSVGISNTVALTGSAVFTSEELAQGAALAFEQMKAEAAANPMVTQFGLGSVVNSMTLNVSGSTATLNANIDATTWSLLTTTLLALIQSEL